MLRDLAGPDQTFCERKSGCCGMSASRSGRSYRTERSVCEDSLSARSWLSQKMLFRGDWRSWTPPTLRAMHDWWILLASRIKRTASLCRVGLCLLSDWQISTRTLIPGDHSSSFWCVVELVAAEWTCHAIAFVRYVFLCFNQALQ